MANYINLEAAVDAVTNVYYNTPDINLSADKLEVSLRRIPAADVAPVVHCKDCAHRTEMGNCGHPRYHGILPSAYPYDFCSYGRPREEHDAKTED